MKKVTVTLELADRVYEYLVGLNALDSLYFGLDMSMQTSIVCRINQLLSNRLARYLYSEKEFFCMVLPEMGKAAELKDMLEQYPALSMELGSDETTFEEPRLECEKKAGDVSTRNPSPDEATRDEAAPDEPEPEPESVSNAEEEAPGDRESEPDDEEDFLSLAPLPCSYPHDPAAQYTPYDPALYENDAYESGGRIVLENPEALAFVDALSAALCR